MVVGLRLIALLGMLVGKAFSPIESLLKNRITNFEANVEKLKHDNPVQQQNFERDAKEKVLEPQVGQGQANESTRRTRAELQQERAKEIGNAAEQMGRWNVGGRELRQALAEDNSSRRASTGLSTGGNQKIHGHAGRSNTSQTM